MYSIEEKVLNKILRKKFISMVGNSLETIELLFKEDIDKTVSLTLIKEAIKKYAYNSMREIEEQISAFSQGVTININLKKPESQ